MANKLNIPARFVWDLAKANFARPPTNPPWYTGETKFKFGIKKDLAEPLNEVAQTYFFTSPFDTSKEFNGSFTYTATKKDVRGTALSRNLQELVAFPPSVQWQQILTQEHGCWPFISNPNLVFEKWIVHPLYKRNFNFALWFFTSDWRYQYVEATHTTRENLPVCLLEIPSGGKILQRQDLTLRASWYNEPSITGFYDFGDTAGCYSGFSIHEAPEGAETEAESYTKVRKRVVILNSYAIPQSKAPRLARGKEYTISTDPAFAPNITADGIYWCTFHPSTSCFNSDNTNIGLKYYTDGYYTNTTVFAGEFSLQQLKEYLNEDTNFYSTNNTEPPYYQNEYVYNAYFDRDLCSRFSHSTNPVLAQNGTGIYLSADSTPSWARLEKNIKYVPGVLELYPQGNLMQVLTGISKALDSVYMSKVGILSTEGLAAGPNVKGTKTALVPVYQQGCFYTQVSDLKPQVYRDGLEAKNKVGVLDWNFVGTAKIEAYTFNGSAPTPYKPVYLMDRYTGRVIRETQSDANGRYVLHAIPAGIEYIAVSIDPSKSFNAVAEEFGVVE